MAVSRDPRSPRIDVLKASDRDQIEILSTLDRAGAPNYQGRERRNDRRLGYREVAGLVIQLRHPGGSVANFLVRPRNLSRTGIGFLHGSFVYKGTPCLLIMKTIDHRSVCVAGKTVRCQFLRGSVHEVGVQFDEPIKVSDFLVSIPTDAQQEHSTELPRLKGRILYVEDSINDQELMRFMVANLGLDLRTVSNGMEALEAASSQPYDLVVTNMLLPGMTGAELAQELRVAGHKGPIIAVSADEREQTKNDALQKGCTRVLAKPFNFDEMTRLLVELLPRDTAGETNLQPLASTHWANVKMRPLILSFLGRLGHDIKQMERLVGVEATYPVLQKLCMDLKGSAGGYGYPQLGEAAMRLHQLVGGSAPAAQLKAQFAELARLAAAADLVRQQAEAAAS